jgi:hypothetical protein
MKKRNLTPPMDSPPAAGLETMEESTFDAGPSEDVS